MTHILLQVIFISLTANAEQAQPKAQPLSETPKWQQTTKRTFIAHPTKIWKQGKDSHCYQYDSYWVVTKGRTEGDGGEDIHVFKMVNSGNFSEDCNTDSKEAVYTLSEGVKHSLL